MGIQDHPAYRPFMKKLGAKRYRKRPLVVEAIQWTGDNFSAVDRFTEHNVWAPENPDDERSLAVFTPEGSMYLGKGDWIIKGIKGEFYPCKADVFELTYEVAE